MNTNDNNISDLNVEFTLEFLRQHGPSTYKRISQSSAMTHEQTLEVLEYLAARGQVSLQDKKWKLS